MSMSYKINKKLMIKKQTACVKIMQFYFSINIVICFNFIRKCMCATFQYYYTKSNCSVTLQRFQGITGKTLQVVPCIARLSLVYKFPPCVSETGPGRRRTSKSGTNISGCWPCSFTCDTEYLRNKSAQFLEQVLLSCISYAG